MIDKNKQSIRQKAQKVLYAKNTYLPKELQSLSLEEIQNLVYELEVHQIELEMQDAELQRIQRELSNTKKRYFDLYNMAPIGYCTIGEDGLIYEANLEVSKLLGVQRDKLLKRPITHFIYKDDQDIYYKYFKKLFISDDQQVCELRMIKKDATPFWVHLTSSLDTNSDDKSVMFLGIHDITKLKKYEQELKNIAYFDTLTGLPNRVLLADRLMQSMAQTQRHNKYLAVLFIDLDSFKEVNDNYGHDVGDQLLVKLTADMSEELREEDTLARIGGDEFVAVLADLADINSSLQMITRLLDSAAKKIQINNMFIQVSASIGVTFYPQFEDKDAGELLHQADQAMYEAKLAGKNQYYIFDVLQNNIIRERYEEIALLDKALKENQFEMRYQPKVNLRTGEIIGVEALLRWRHPQKGLISPSEFFPIIEGHSLSIEIGEWAIHKALLQIELWQKQGINICISVNVSSRQLLEDNFIERLKSILAQHSTVKSSMLELEILETSKLEDLLQATHVVHQCKIFGLVFSVDDFGLGYSSLTFVKRIPSKYIKVEQNFVVNMLGNPEDLSILYGVVSIAKAFKRSVIAEGVETLEHGRILIQLGCELGQGYAIARPMKGDELIVWLNTWEPDESWKNQQIMSTVQRNVFFATLEHYSWIAKVKAVLEDKNVDNIESDDLQECYFTEWLLPSDKQYLTSGYEKVDVLHKKIHAFANQLLQLHSLGYKEEALEGVAELDKQRDELIEGLNKI